MTRRDIEKYASAVCTVLILMGAVGVARAEPLSTAKRGDWTMWGPFNLVTSYSRGIRNRDDFAGYVIGVAAKS